MPNVSVRIEITSLVGSRLDVNGNGEGISFNVKARLEERERKSQLVKIGFGLLLTTKPSVVRFEIEGFATLAGKDEDIRKMLEVDPETKVPHVLPRVYQHAFTAMYLLSTILNTPPPPHDLLGTQQPTSSMEDAGVEVQTKVAEPAEAKVTQPEVQKEEKNEATVSNK